MEIITNYVDMISSILTVKNAGKKIQDQWIWENLNFEIFSGDKVAIFGVSGSGKSVLLRALASQVHL
nr:ATP-binding cassette domain-containing protein [Nostoc sp. DedQUE03]